MWLNGFLENFLEYIDEKILFLFVLLGDDKEVRLMKIVVELEVIFGSYYFERFFIWRSLKRVVYIFKEFVRFRIIDCKFI